MRSSRRLCARGEIDSDRSRRGWAGAFCGSQNLSTAGPNVSKDGRGHVTRKTDPVGRATVYNYDPNNGTDLLSIQQVNGQNLETLAVSTYNSQHQPLTVADAAGQTTSNSYDSKGRISTTTTPLRAGIAESRTTTYTYYPDNAATGAGQLATITGPDPAATTTYGYDSYGRPNTVTDSENYAVVTDYDALDRPVKVTYPDLTYEQTIYNRLDAEQHRDRLGRWTHTFHDALRRVSAVRDPAGRTTTYEWCNCGSLDKITDANQNSTSWQRDVQGRITQETRADNGPPEVFAYESTTSRLKTRTDAKGQVTTYTYALDDHISQTSYTNATIATPSVSVTYDPVYDRPSSVTDGAGTTNYSYYPITVSPTLGAGRIQSVSGPLANSTVSYSYDELGRIATRGLATFGETTSYDALGRRASLVSPVGTFNWTYVNTTDRPQTVTYPNGQITQYTYFGNTGDQRLQQIKHLQSSGGSVLSQFDYSYDAVGNIGTWQQQFGVSGAKIYGYGYDAADQLTSAVQKDATTQQVLKNYGYAYDAAGNRTVAAQDSMATTSQYNNRNQLTQQVGGANLPVAGILSEPATVTVSGAPASVNAANQFAGTAQAGTGTQNFTVVATDPSGNRRTNTYQVTVSGTPRSFSYDLNGNMMSETDNGITTTYDWDAENRLVDVKQSGTTVAAFVYDGLGRRVQKTSGGVTHSFVYDSQNLLEERLSSGQTIDYVHPPETDRPLAQRDQSGAVSYYLADHLGSIAQTTTSSGSVALTREYDPWGNLLQGSATGGFAFTGREWDPETNLYYYRARFYAPQLGRFLSEDPLGPTQRSPEQLNDFAYVANHPINRTDPSGEGFLNCCKVLADLTAAMAKLAQRIAEQEAGSKDPAVVAGHAKAIVQLSARVRTLATQAAKSCGEAGKEAAEAAEALLLRAQTFCLTIVIIDPCVIDPSLPGCGV